MAIPARFSGKRVVVTGAASGIGRATAVRFAAEGADVIIADINADGLNETAGLMARPADIAPYDAADYASCRALIDRAAAGGGIDVLCNVAGMLGWGATPDFDEDRFDRILHVNLTSVFSLCRAAIPHLATSKGCIVNTASTAGLTGLAYTLAYSASKHGVVAVTKGLAIELAAQGVRVNAIAPGQVNTPMGHAAPPSGELNWDLVMRNLPKLAMGAADPEDIAAGFSYLASEEARNITGTILTIDAGLLAG